MISARATRQRRRRLLGLAGSCCSSPVLDYAPGWIGDRLLDSGPSDAASRGFARGIVY